METYAQIGYVERERPSSVRGRPFDTRVGGLPAYYSGAAVDTPTCSGCHRPLFFVAQIYAPAARDRTLYVFACNSRVCNSTRVGHSSWRVVRSQGSPVESEHTEAHHDAEPGVRSETSLAPSGDHASSDSWGSAGVWDDGESGSAAITHIGESASSTTDATASSYSSLSERLSSSCRIGTEPLPLNDTLPHPFIFPAFDVLTCDDPDEEEEGDSSDDSDSEPGQRKRGAQSASVRLGPFTDSSGSGSGSRTEYSPLSTASGAAKQQQLQLPTAAWRTPPAGGADAHALQLLAEYEAQVNTGVYGVDGDEGVDDDEDVCESDDDDDEDGTKSTTARGKGPAAPPLSEHLSKPDRKSSSRGPPAGDHRAGKSRRRVGASGASTSATATAAHAGGGSEKYERVPARTRAALRFQRRLSSFPTQCMRYEWDGSPLWPIPKKDAEALFQSQSRATSSSAQQLHGGRSFLSVPACASCGSPRVFEAQLMPYVLLLLRVEELTAEDAERRAGAIVAADEESGGTAAASASTSNAAGLSTQTPSAPDSRAAALPSPDSLHSLDFATVLIYCCSGGCDGTEEFAVAIPFHNT